MRGLASASRTAAISFTWNTWERNKTVFSDWRMSMSWLKMFVGELDFSDWIIDRIVVMSDSV